MCTSVGYNLALSSMLRISSKQITVIVAIFLLCCPPVEGTALVVLVSGRTIVFGADGKGVDVLPDNLKVFGTQTENKVVILQERLIISTEGIGRIVSKDRGMVYEFNTWAKSLPIRKTDSISDVANLISSKCWPIFHSEWARRHPTHPLNLSNDPDLPLVGYYVGGIHGVEPKVYFVAIVPDWKNHILNQPTIKQIYPLVENSPWKNIFAIFNGKNGGGMDQLITDNSTVQRQYLKLYDKEVGALIYDEPLDGVSLVNLGVIMLRLEIKITPDSFSFPLTLCSIINQRPSCQSYTH
jgi:hypothetical protein